MATTHDKTVGGTAEQNVTEAGFIFTLRRVYDTAATGDGNVASGDTLQLLNIPADTLVLGVALVVQTVEGGTLTVDVGEVGGDADGWLDGADLNAAATKASMPATLVEGAPNTITPAFGMGRLYTAADTIDMLFNNAADAVKFELIAICVRLKKAASQNSAFGSV
jgi:hypothetical protein